MTAGEKRRAASRRHSSGSISSTRRIHSASSSSVSARLDDGGAAQFVPLDREERCAGGGVEPVAVLAADGADPGCAVAVEVGRDVVVDEVDVVAAAQLRRHARLVGVGDAHDLVVRFLQVRELARGVDADQLVHLDGALAHGGRHHVDAAGAQFGDEGGDHVLDAAVAGGGTGSQGPEFSRILTRRPPLRRGRRAGGVRPRPCPPARAARPGRSAASCGRAPRRRPGGPGAPGGTRR